MTCSELIDLVEGDTRPPVIVQLDDECNGNPIDLTDADEIVMYFRQIGAETLKATLTGTKIVGWENDEGLIVTTAPFDVAGVGGRVSFAWGPDDLDTPGRYEGEIEVRFSDGTEQTVLDRLRFRVRAQMA